MKVRIREARLLHGKIISKRLRPEDEAEIRAVHGDPRLAIRRIILASPYRRVAYVDGEVAALWGCDGTLLSTEAHAWLVTTAAVEKVPLTFFREARRELREMLQSRRLLVSHAAASYEKALRFMRMLGFTVGEPRPLGRKGEMYCELRIEA